MAIEYTMRAVCDQCGAIIEPSVRVAKAGIDNKRWEWRDKWKKCGVMRGLQPKLRQAKLYCARCAGS